MKILVVDDNKSNAKVIAKTFMDEAYDILYAKNGSDGYQLALSEQPDLILMDWAMPIMNGIEAVLKIKAKPDTWHIPILMITGVMTDSDDLRQAFEAGAMDFIRKPFEELELRARVQSALRLSASMKEVRNKSTQVEELLAKEKAYFERELNHKHRELSRMAIVSHEQNNFLSRLLKEVNQLEQDLSVSNVRALQKEIKHQVLAEDTWSSFMHHFDQVHPDFFNCLKEKHNLTNNELKLAAYVKIGMKNKEIAAMTGIEPGSVKSSIYRMKRKMNLLNGKELSEYLFALDRSLELKTGSSHCLNLT